MIWLSTLLIGILASIVAMAIWENVRANNSTSLLDDNTLSLLLFALKLLPDSERERYEDEWLMFLCDQPSAAKRFLNAVSFVKASMQICADVKILVPLSEAVSTKGQIWNSSKFSDPLRYFSWLKVFQQAIVSFANASIVFANGAVVIRSILSKNSIVLLSAIAVTVYCVCLLLLFHLVNIFFFDGSLGLKSIHTMIIEFLRKPSEP